MKTNELIAILRDEDNPNVLDYIQEAADTLESQQKRIEELEAEQAKPLTAFLSPIDAYKGLKRKFLVFKSDTGEMVENCFVLCPGNDPAAVEALRAYARATNNATLSADIVNWVGEGEERRWIPVTERLPEHSDGHVLVTDGEQVKISCRNACYKTASGEVRCAQGYGSGMPVTHWMPLPEPPKEV